MPLLGKIIAPIAILGWLAVLILESARPGFVVFFWNPMWLLVLGIFGLAISVFSETNEQKSYPHTIRIFLAIIAAVLIWNMFPESITGLAVSFASFLLVMGIL